MSKTAQIRRAAASKKRSCNESTTMHNAPKKNRGGRPPGRKNNATAAKKVGFARRTSRRGNASSIDPSIISTPVSNNIPPQTEETCIDKNLPATLQCGFCIAKADPIGNGFRGIGLTQCRQLWERDNCEGQEDFNANDLIMRFIDHGISSMSSSQLIAAATAGTISFPLVRKAPTPKVVAPKPTACSTVANQRPLPTPYLQQRNNTFRPIDTANDVSYPHKKSGDSRQQSRLTAPPTAAARITPIPHDISHTHQHQQNLSTSCKVSATKRAATSTTTASTSMIVHYRPPSMIECRGIAEGDSGSILSYAATAFRHSARELDAMSCDKDFGTERFKQSLLSGNMDLLQPHANMKVKKKPDGSGFMIVDMNCLGWVKNVPGQRVRVPRCVCCSKRVTTGNREVNRSFTPILLPYGPKTPISTIVKDEAQAAHEIKRLRKTLKQLKKQRADTIIQQNIDKHGVPIPYNRAKSMMNALQLIEKELEDQLYGTGSSEPSEQDENKFVLWKAQLLHMLRVFENGGNLRGIKLIPELLEWSTVKLARGSVNGYLEDRKVFMLPHISTVYRNRNKIISSRHMRAFSFCPQTARTISDRANREGWDDNARYGFLPLDSAGTAKGMQWDYRLNQMVGQCQAHKYEPLRNKFDMMANKMKAGEMENNGELADEEMQGTSGSILDNVKLADQHLVGIWVSMSPKVDCAEIVVSTDVENVSAPVMYRVTKLAAELLPNYGLYVAGNIVDAAGPNWKALLADSTHSAQDILPKVLRDEFPDVDFSLKHISVDPVTDQPIVHIPDSMHCTKAVAHALENSNSPSSKRNIMYGNCPCNLGLTEACWKATGGGTAQLQATKLSEFHFYRCSNSRMDVAISMQLLSGSTARMMRKAIDDDSITIGNFRNKKVLTSMVILTEKWNRLVDIVNDKNGEHYTPENGLALQKELLSILNWFCKWKKKHDNGVAEGKKTVYNFFALETWKVIQMMILSHVVLIQLYPIQKNMEIYPRVINTDPCEHHFGNGRQMVGGSTNSMTTSQWGYADTQSGSAKSANYSTVGNNKTAPVRKEKRKKF